MQTRSKKISRQFKRYLGHEDAEILIADFVPVIQENFTKKISSALIDILGNFSRFIDIVDNSYAEYEDRLKVAARNIEISSEELTTAYRNVEGLNANINAMLDSLGQGLLFFDNQGICSSVHSKVCLALLDGDPSLKPLAAVLNFSQEQEKHFKSWLPIAFSGNTALDFEDMTQLLPDEITNSRGQVIELDYRPMYGHDRKLEGILLIATDVTYQRESEKKMQTVQRNAQKIQQIAQNRNGFHHFLTDLYSFIGMADRAETNLMNEEDKIAILRELHTFKGQASTFSLSAISEKLHETEMRLRGENKNFVPVLQDELRNIEVMLEDEKEFARELFGPDFITLGRVRIIEIAKIHNLIDTITKTVSNKAEQEKLKNMINHGFLSMPVFDVFLSFQRELSRLAEQQGKAVPVCNISGDNVPIVMSSYEKFFNVLNHLARNIIDHGIEMPLERVDCGKDRQGEVNIRIKKIDNAGINNLEFFISDDGRGIDTSIIRQKLAEERGIDTAKEDDETVLQHIFDPDFSLKSQITLISGRGVGMNALKAEVENIGGKISVSSDWENHKGTTFYITLPYML